MLAFYPCKPCLLCKAKPVSATLRPRGPAANISSIICGIFRFCSSMQPMLFHMMLCSTFCLPSFFLTVLHDATFSLCAHSWTQLAAMLQATAFASGRGEDLCLFHVGPCTKSSCSWWWALHLIRVWVAPSASTNGVHTALWGFSVIWFCAFWTSSSSQI